MSNYRLGRTAALHDPVTGDLVGFLGLNGRAYSVTATASAGGGGIVQSTAGLFDPATGAPVGFIGADGQEYVIAMTEDTTGTLSGAVRRPVASIHDAVTRAYAGAYGRNGRAFAVSAAGGGGAVVVDTDVAAYASAVSAAGGSLPPAHQTALNDNIAALKESGAWALIKELWLPLGANGDLTTAAVKLKNGAAAASVTLTNFVSGDYTVALGMDPGLSNSTKKILTGFTPSVHGSLSGAEWGFSAYVTRATGTGINGGLMGTVTGQTAYLQYTGGPQSTIAGTNIGIAPDGGTVRTKRMQSIQVSGGSIAHYVGGWARNTGAAANSTLPSVALAVLSTNGGLFSDAAVSGYAIHSAMTPAQLRALQTFFDNVCTAIGRTIFAETLNSVGDSYTAPTPTGPSSAAADWVAVAAASKGWPYVLNGSGGRGWCVGATNMNSVGKSVIANTVLASPSKRVIFPMGLNDAYYANGTGALVTSSIAANIGNVLLAVGYPAAYISLATGPWATNALPVQGEVNQAIQDAATAYGVHLVDFYAGGTRNVTAYETDGLHKNDAGHAVLAQDFLTAASGWAGW